MYKRRKYLKAYAFNTDLFCTSVVETVGPMLWILNRFTVWLQMFDYRFTQIDGFAYK